MGMLKLGRHGIRTPAVCGSVIGPDIKTMRAGAVRAIKQGADLIELRIDGLRNPTGWEKLLRTRVPAILTNRPKREGGKFKGGEEKRVEFLLEGITRGVACIDIELSTPGRLREETIARAKEANVSVLMSHHDFSSTPSVDVLMSIADRLAKSKCDLVKIVTFAKRTSDALRMLDFLAQAQDAVAVPVIAFAMGDAGGLSRIAAPLFGSPIVYAAAGETTAPGQLDVQTTKRLIRELMSGRERVMKRVKLFALIGDPVKQSLSPAMHNAAFRALKLSCAYVALRIPKALLADAIAGVRAMGIGGLNVTTPHKVAIVNSLDELDKSATLVGAVNTVKNERGRLVGYNTDGEGAIRALEEKIGSLDGLNVVLLGAGGAARAIAFSLVKVGARISIANRTPSKARALATAIDQELGKSVELISLNHAELARALKDADVLINATTVGMRPNVNKTLATASMMHRKLVVNDIVYEPLQTRLLREAKRAGAKTVDGLGMLVHQGALAFEIWTGKRAPIKVMEAATKRELRRRGE